MELLEDYCSRLTSPTDKQLRIAIEKVIYIFKSSLFQALLDIQEFYEAILLDDNKDANSKALAVLRIADKWLENAPLPGATNNEYRNGLMVQVNNANNNGNLQNMPSPIAIGKKSPSFHSNKSNENMSVDGGAGNNGQENPNSYTVPSYDDHWVFEKIVLERVSGLFVYLVRGNSGRSLILKKIKKRAILGLYCLAKSERYVNSSVFFG